MPISARSCSILNSEVEIVAEVVEHYEDRRVPVRRAQIAGVFELVSQQGHSYRLYASSEFNRFISGFVQEHRVVVHDGLLYC
jgi:hypothetical protein